MNNFFELLVAGLATYRIARLVVVDEIFSRPRNAVWKKFPPERSKFGYLFTCMWCTSIWVASLLEISRMIIPNVVHPVGIVLAISAIAGLLAAYEEK
jgi:hypothetical protein